MRFSNLSRKSFHNNQCEALTPKQEKFARLFVEKGNASKAYRLAYTVGENTLTKTIWECASRLKANRKVTARIMNLQEAATERTLVTIAQLTNELDQERELAHQQKNASAAISATMGKAKLHGLLSRKIDMRSVDKSMTPVTINLVAPILESP